MPNLRTQLSAVQVFLHGMSLQVRFLLIIGISLLLFALVTWGVFNNVPNV